MMNLNIPELKYYMNHQGLNISIKFIYKRIKYSELKHPLAKEQVQEVWEKKDKLPKELRDI